MTTRFTAAHWGAYRIEGDSLLPVSDDPSPSRIGGGWAGAMRDPRTRIARPAIREGWLRRRDRASRCNDRFVEVGWDEALDLLAGEIARIRSEHGNRALYAGSYGWASTGRFHHAQSQLRRFLNGIGGFVSSRETYSHAAAEVILPHIVGQTNDMFQNNMTTWPLIARHCRLMVAFGGISGRTAQISSGGTAGHEVRHWLAEAARNGMETVLVSPRASDGEDMAGAEWLPIRPGTDTVLMLGLAHAIHAAGRTDRGFLDRCTSGWETFEAYLTGAADGTPKTPAWAAGICDVPEARITALADRLARTPHMISVAWGLQRADHGEQPVWMGLTLAAMLGRIGQPGTGFGFGYGAVTPVGRPARQIAWPALPQGLNPVADFIPVARIADMLLNPGGEYPYNGRTRIYPDARMVWWSGGNPFHHHQDLNRLEAAWTRPETVVVQDLAWTATARRADIVLPMTAPLERMDLMINPRDPTLIFMEPVRPPFAQARDDHAALADLADRMGTRDAFTEGRDVEGWLRWMWAGCQSRAQAAGFALPDFDGFRAMGRFDCPDAYQDRIQLGAFVADPEAAPLRTESGKITIGNAGIAAMGLPDCPGHPVWREPVEWLGRAEPGQLHLISAQPDTRLHGQLDNGPVSRAAKIRDREPCVLHPDTAAAHGLAAGDVALIGNARGACLAGVTLSEGIRRDCIALPTGAWFDPQEVDGRRIEVHGNPNVLTIDKGASALSQGNIAHTALVRIGRWDGPLPAIRVFDPPEGIQAQGG